MASTPKDRKGKEAQRMSKAEKDLIQPFYPVYREIGLNLLNYTDEQAGQFIKAASNYFFFDEEPQFTDKKMGIAWAMMKDQIDRSRESYANRCRASRENGKKGGRPKADKEAEPASPAPF